MYNNKLILLLAISLISITTFSQGNSSKITGVSLQASGLTCSMCSNSINKALKSLSFVEKVDANIKTSSFEITFKPTDVIELDKIKKKVQDAGFSVALFVAHIHFANMDLSADETFDINGNKIQLVNSKEQKINGDKQIKLIDKGFMLSSKNEKVNSPVKINSRVYHATIG